jgi:hypothetical protein
LRAATVRRLGLGTLIDTFLVSAATCLLLIRTILAATGWPQLGNDSLHIAHMLWGGVGMLLALFMVFVFSSRYVIFAASVVGGLGFGAFIDELGKFITSDNNYFFEPTIGLIYIIFVVLYLTGRALEKTIHPSQKTYIVNAVDLTKEAFIVGLGKKQREQALGYLAHCDPSEPVVVGLQNLIHGLEPSVPEPPGRLARAGAAMRRFYRRLIVWRPFAWLVTAAVVVFVVANLVWMIALTIGWEAMATNLQDLSFGESGQIVGSLISAVLGLAGAVVFWFSRIWGYRLFDYAVLASIFITQIFRFWQHELAAITGLVISLVLHLILSYAIKRETQEALEPEG